MYLEPIFGSEDIKKKMPLEYRKFEAIDRMFRSTIESFARDSSVWDGIDSDKLKNDFSNANKMLDTI